MNTVLVTGGCGFIGCHVVRTLLEKTDRRVVVLDNLTYAGSLDNLTDVEESARFRFVKGDICDRSTVDSLFREERPFAVVNLAAESHVDRSILDARPFFETNVIGVQVLLETAVDHGIERFVQISSDEVYGDSEGQAAATESSPLAPSSPYSSSKAAADLLALAYLRTHDVPVLIVRSSNNYGPFQFPEKFIPLLTRNAMNGDNLPIYGDGMQLRDWLYVEDNVDAILRVLDQGTVGSVYNVGTEAERTNLEIAQAVCRGLAELEGGLDVEALLGRVRLVADRPGHDRRYMMDTGKIRQELGWSPKVSFEEGLKITLQHYLKRPDSLDKASSGDYQAYYEAVYSRAWGRSA